MAAVVSNRGGLEYGLAGLRVCSNRRVDEPARSVFRDGKVDVVFGDGPPGDEDCLLLERERMGTEIYLSCDGNKIFICGKAERPAHRALLIRRALPYASYLQGKPVLHASAVMRNGCVAAFTGESGAGKTTLASELGRRGYALVSDDLLPCRVRGGEITVPFSCGAEATEHPLSRIYFLTRSKGIQSIRVSEVTGTDFLSLLVSNGYGDLEDSSLRECQFGFMLRAAERTKGYLLEIPDGLEKLERAVSALSRTFDKTRWI